jgi:hypothetical protein
MRRKMSETIMTATSITNLVVALTALVTAVGAIWGTVKAHGKANVANAKTETLTHVVTAAVNGHGNGQETPAPNGKG